MLTAAAEENRNSNQALSPTRRGSILRMLSAYLAENGEMLGYSAGPGLPGINVTLRKTNNGYDVDLYEVARGSRAKSTISYVEAADADVAEGDGVALHPPKGQSHDDTEKRDAILRTLEREISSGFRESFKDPRRPSTVPFQNKSIGDDLTRHNSGDLAELILKVWAPDLKRYATTTGHRTLMFAAQLVNPGDDRLLDDVRRAQEGIRKAFSSLTVEVCISCRGTQPHPRLELWVASAG